MKIWIARDTGEIGLFKNKPVKSEASEDGFFYFYDPILYEPIGVITDPPDDLKNHLEVGEMFEQELGGF